VDDLLAYGAKQRRPRGEGDASAHRGAGGKVWRLGEVQVGEEEDNGVGDRRWRGEDVDEALDSGAPGRRDLVQEVAGAE
jgi:hypothetical protein